MLSINWFDQGKWLFTVNLVQISGIWQKATTSTDKRYENLWLVDKRYEKLWLVDKRHEKIDFDSRPETWCDHPQKETLKRAAQASAIDTKQSFEMESLTAANAPLRSYNLGGSLAWVGQQRTLISHSILAPWSQTLGVLSTRICFFRIC